MQQGWWGLDIKRNTWGRKKGIQLFMWKTAGGRGLGTGAWAGKKLGKWDQTTHTNLWVKMLAFKAFSAYYIKYIICSPHNHDRYPRTISHGPQAIRIPGREWCLSSSALVFSSTLCFVNSWRSLLQHCPPPHMIFNSDTSQQCQGFTFWDSLPHSLCCTLSPCLQF